MRSDAIIIVGVGFQNPAQMRLAQDNDVVHTLTPDRSDQAFGKAILPRRGRCGRLVPDAHGAQSGRKPTECGMMRRSTLYCPLASSRLAKASLVSFCIVLALASTEPGQRRAA